MRLVAKDDERILEEGGRMKKAILYINSLRTDRRRRQADFEPQIREER